MLSCPLCAGIRVSAVHVPPGRELIRCRDCRLLFASGPAPVHPLRACLSDDERRLEERVASRRAPCFARLLAAAGPAGRLLDVGTGIGEMLRLAREAGWEAVGVDIDPAVVAYARARGLDARVGELATLRLPASSFDLVTLWNVLDFVREPLALLRECRRLLVPGGRVFVRTPNVPLQREGARLTAALRAAGLGRFPHRPAWVGIFHMSNFSAHTLRVALGRAGFADIEIGNSAPVGGDPYLGLDRVGESVLGLGKRLVFGVVQAAAVASGGRWLLGPSLQAWGRAPR